MQAAGPTSIDWIMQQSRRYPLLTPEEEIKLGRQVQAWLPLRQKEKLTKKEQQISSAGKRAYDKFFLSNIRLVVQLAGKYVRRSGMLTHEDLVQEGMLGLERAITRFDSSRGYKFSTYAYSWIRQSIFRAISNKARAIRLPCNALSAISHARQYMESVKKETGKTPTIEETAKEVGVNAETLRGYLEHINPPTSLDLTVQIAEVNGATYLDMLADPNSLNDPLDAVGEYTNAVLAAIGQLEEIDQEILEHRYFGGNEDPPTFDQIAKSLDISRQTCSLRHRQSLNRLRRKLCSIEATV
jgi:RNA polymerase sigma factor (sigma-70 family)